MQYYRSGTVLAADEVHTAGDAAKVAMEVDYRGDELVYLTASVLDSKGILVHCADNLLNFSVSGPAEILATDAGDPTSHASFRSPSVKALAGQATVILKRTGKGRIVVKADSEGLKPAQLSEK